MITMEFAIFLTIRVDVDAEIHAHSPIEDMKDRLKKFQHNTHYHIGSTDDFKVVKKEILEVSTSPYLPPEGQEYIKNEHGTIDAWVCVCGNTPCGSGFSACDKDGNEMEPLIGSNWDHLLVCFECGRIIHCETLQVMGQNPNFKMLER
jgi:hypothetical protein